MVGKCGVDADCRGTYTSFGSQLSSNLREGGDTGNEKLLTGHYIIDMKESIKRD